MRTYLILILGLLILPAVTAQDDLYNYAHLTIENTVTTGFTVIQGRVQYVNVNLSIYPLESPAQLISSVSASPTPLPGTKYAFRFDNPRGKQVIKVSTVVENQVLLPIANNNVKFPLAKVPVNMSEYLATQEIIDITPEISRLASELAGDKKDAYEVAFSLADWVHKEIHYELSSTTVDASLPASWVLKNRKGVCDELTALFIAMSRSLGIPARFVAGVAYTNLNDANQWGPHGWAELYFPDVGWVPFDVTYGEFGYVDATHVRMIESLDARRDAVEYTYSGYGVELETLPITFDTKLVAKHDLLKPLVKLAIEPVKEEVGPGSYNAMRITIHNPTGAYAPVTLRITRTEGLDYLDDSFVRPVLLKPYETREIIIPFYVRPNLAQGYVYTFPLGVSTLRGGSASSSFKASKGMIIYPKIIFESDVKVPSADQPARLVCSASSNMIHVGEDAIASCTFVSEVAEDITLCLIEECYVQPATKGKEYEFSMSSTLNEPGVHAIAVTATGNDIALTSILAVEAWDEVNLSIDTGSFPSGMDYGDNVDVSISIYVSSAALPSDMILRVKAKNVYNELDLGDYEKPVNVTMTVHGSSLTKGANDFAVELEYKDPFGKMHTQTSAFTTVLKPMSASQTMRYFMGNVSRWLRNLF
ncbi:MAG: transglutaminase-like domain-containing protein [Candidatus Woesearchaeota archaeon]